VRACLALVLCSCVNYSWGIGNHGQKQGGAIFPEMTRWLWRDQPVPTDPADGVERSFRAAFVPRVEVLAQPAKQEPLTTPSKEDQR
jgi:hypothetical protein